METEKGLAVTAFSMNAVESINDFHHQILGSGPDALKILDAAVNYPDCPLIQTYAGIAYLYAQENSATEIAEKYFAQAEKTLHSANLREKLIYYAAKAWASLDYQGALSILTAIVHLFPRDTLALKFAEWLFYCVGQAQNAEPFLSLCEQAAGANQKEPHFLAIHSFALELNGRYQEAQQMAEKAMDLEAATPWAHHTLAHVYLLTQQMDKGTLFLESVAPSWNQIFTLLKSHNTWHLALFYLSKRDERKILELYRQGIFGVLPDSVGEQIDAISLLWRMDMAGLNQKALYEKIVSHLNQHPWEYYSGFNSVHFIYALAKSGKGSEAEEALNKLKAHAANLRPAYDNNLWKDLHIPFCEFVFQFARGNYSAAYNVGTPIINHCFKLGGSDAQDELFLQTYLLSLLGCKKTNEAQNFFNRYLSHYRNTSLADYWFTHK
ncbi:tetratricopeptide repeat protein [Legionella nagasakiensis]|uniref:tetratricopeptide repeat protein n=1 Tax=Legionella nagasakiensis TaxID=535290 RepID=UPI0010563C69|nr:tetratricopeptide repeat protein [Legionella nagasakiensis]